MVISIFKRQRFRLLDRDHSRIGFAGNDRHGAFMMVSRPRRAIELAPYALAPSGHAAVTPPSSVMSSRRPPRRRRWRIRSNDAIPFSAQGVWAHAFGRDPPLAGPA